MFRHSRIQIVTGLGGALIALSATGSMAQGIPADGMCGLTSPQRAWAGGDSATSDPGQSATALDVVGSVSGVTPSITVFNLASPGRIRIEAMAQGLTGDTVVNLYDAAGIYLEGDDDSGGALSSRIETDLGSGTYCVETSGFGGEVLDATVRIGSIDLNHVAMTQGVVDVASVACGPDTEAVMLGAGALGAGLSSAPAAATASVSGVPFYRFSLSEPMAVTLTATNEEADPLIRLFDNTGEQLAENDDFDGLNSRIDMSEPLAIGTYCVGLSALGEMTAPVTLTLSAYDEATYLTSLYDSGTASPPLDGTYPVEDLGIVETRLRGDIRVSGAATWVTFEVNETGVVVIDAVAVTDGADPLIRLFDDFGRQVGENDDFGGDLNSQLITKVSPGQYMLAVTDINDQSPQRIRIAVERYVAAR